MLAEYLAIVRPLEVFLSEKFKCKDAGDLNEFHLGRFQQGTVDG
jgi:hypothetical protein